MSKQLTLQIGALAVLVLVAAALLWKLPSLSEKQEEVEQPGMLNSILGDVFDEDNINTDQALNNPQYDAITQMYINEGYPTATELSPDLREMIVNLYTQTDAFAVVDQMPFGHSGEVATLVAVPSVNEYPFASCGAQGQALCFLLYTNGDRMVDVIDVLQTLSNESPSYYEDAPKILDILSMPFAGDVLITGVAPDAGYEEYSRWDVVEGGVRKNVAAFAYTDTGIHLTSDVAKTSVDLDIDLQYDEASQILYRTVKVRDGQTILSTLSKDLPDAENFEGPWSSAIGFMVDPEQTLARESLFFEIFGVPYSFGLRLNDQGQSVNFFEEAH